MTTRKAPNQTNLGALSSFAPELASTMASIASDIALVIDEAGVISDVAEGSEFLTPWSSSWIGQRWVDTVTAGTRHKIELLLDEARKSGVTRRREVNHPASGGDDIPVAWAAVRLGDGGPVVAVGRDLRAVAAIQQRFLQAQQEMEQVYWRRRHVDSRYRILFQVASDAVLIVEGPDYDIVEANEAATDLLGGHGGALVGRPFLSCIVESSHGSARDLLSGALAAGRTKEATIRLHAGELPAELAVTPFRVGDQHHFVLRARRGSSGSNSEVAKLVEFVEATPDAVVIVDSVGHIQVANPAFVSLVQQGDEPKLKGRLLEEVLGASDGRVRAMVERVQKHGMAPRWALDVVLAGNGGRPMEATAALMTDGEQELIGITMRASEREIVGIEVEPNTQLDQAFSQLAAQIGRVPLSDLLTEMGHVAERHLIAAALTRAGGRLPLAAEMLGLTPESLVLRLKRHGLGGLDFDGQVVN